MTGPEVKDAASVILFRPRAATGDVEFFLLRRHRKAGFMASSYVFPGGVADADDRGEPRTTAARELFEEAGILLSADAVTAAEVEALRQRLLRGDVAFSQLLADAGLRIDERALHYFSHWITPSVEKRRYSARFFLCRLPPLQRPSFDTVETVDEIWVTAEEALARSATLKLPPPQVHMFGELLPYKEDALAGLLSDQRATHAHAILPRLCATDSGFALLLPWDPQYESHGTGARLTMEAGHPLARGPSRFVFENAEWKNVDPPKG